MTEEQGFLEGVEGADKLIEKGLDSAPKLAEAYRQLETELQSRPKPPGENASSEDLQRFRERIGMIKPEGDGYVVPEDIGEAERQRVADATEMLPKGSMTDAEYRDFAHKMASRDASERSQGITQAREAMFKHAEASRAEHGVDAMIATETFMDDQFGSDPALLKVMKSQAKNPLVVQAFSTLVEAMKPPRENPMHEANIRQPAQKLSIQQLGHELAQIQNITNSPEFNSADPKNSELVDKADSLFKIMHDGGFRSAQAMINHRD